MKKCILLSGFVLCFLSLMAEDIILFRDARKSVKNNLTI